MQRAHHYGHLIERWKALARSLGMRLQRYGVSGRWPLYCLRTKGLRSSGGMYFSAGIHGDEPGATEGLLAWALEQGEALRGLPLFLLPCLNPWGLVNNSRFNLEGVDLNRSFHRDDLPDLVALRELVKPYEFEFAMNLHEDYDGQGFYLYEIQRQAPYWGERLIHAAQAVIPIEDRARVDGRKAAAGLIRRRLDYRRFGQIGYPEAIWLHLHHSRRTFTIETPSEFALEQRVRAQVAVIAAAVELWRESARPAAVRAVTAKR